MTVAVVIDQMESGGARLTPATILVIGELTGSLSDELSRWLIIPLIIVFFAGELVWRERDAGLGEITDAMPGSDWSPFLGKFLGLGLMVALFMALLTMAGILAQLISGYQNFEIGLYLKIMFGLQLPDYLLFALLALVVHVLVHEKYVGHLVAILAYAFIALPSLFGVEHNLLVYGGGPGWSYTEMRGFGSSLGPWLWFKLYWAAWALLLAVAARLLWVRGRETSVGLRLRWARRRFTRPTTWTAAAAVGLVFTLGGFIFYNTNVLNAYLSASDLADRQAEYERRFGRYAGIPQPRLAGTNLRIEIHPDRREVEIRGSYHLENRQRRRDRLHPRGHGPRGRDRRDRLRSAGGERARRRGPSPPNLRARAARSCPVTPCGSTSRCASRHMAFAKAESTPRWWRTAPTLRVVGCRPSAISRVASS